MFGSSFRYALAVGLLLGGLSLHADEGPDLTQACEQFTAAKLNLWKGRLSLTDWDVTIVLTKRADLKPRTLGGVRWDKRKHTAIISVMHPSDYDMPLEDMLNDMEETVVHELLHLKLSPLNRSEAARSSEEEAVNGIAGALLRLERAK